MEKDDREIIGSSRAPEPIGPYSQAVRVRLSGAGLIFTSGQIGIDRASGTIPEGIEAQTRQVLYNLKAILEENGSGMDRIVKTTVFLKDMNDFGTMNRIYGEYFDSDLAPARSAVEVARLPKDVLVEIEAVALA